MKFWYNISIYLLSFAMWAGRLFVRKARLRGQWKWEQKDRGDRNVILVHCASLGEFEQGRPLIEALRAKYPNSWIVVSFFSPSGYEVRKNFEGVDEVIYLPLDTPRGARRFASELKPEMAFFIKYEYWYNILKTLHSVSTKIYLVSAIMRSDAQFFRSKAKGGDFFRSILDFYTTIFVQDKASSDLLASIGITKNVVVSGDTRFDRVADLISTARELPVLEKFRGSRFTVVCGSTWGADEDLLLDLMLVHGDWNFIIAPHEISRTRIDKFVESSGRKAIIYTDDSTYDDDATLCVIDCIGILSSAYRYGDAAYIGGGFGVGIHNTLEAATWGVAVVFGPKYAKFAEARALIACGAGFSVADSGELAQVFEDIYSNYKEIGSRASDFVKTNIGATSSIMISV